MGITRRNWNYRVICDCQRHARRRQMQRLARAAVVHLRRRSMALIVGIPLAFCAMGLPMDAMNMSLPALASSQPDPQPSLHIFTTPRIRAAFLNPSKPVETFTLEFAKEQFFTTEVPYGAIIYREARRNNLPPELVAAVVEAESDFRPRLVSEKNAQGLMQILPETSRILGCDNPFNPSENVAAGTRYLRYLLDRFGDQRTALAAYNAGEGNIERFGGVPPFPETLNYLQRVSYVTHVYRQRVRNRYIASVRMGATLIE
jgi:soluble lytic murein transglycosylase-like protein